MFLKWLYLLFGSLSIIGGLITFWLPVPIGVPLVLIGAPIIMRHSPQGRRWILRLLKHFPSLQNTIKEQEERISRKLDDK